MKINYLLFKRFGDITLSLILLIILSPIIVVSLLIQFLELKANPIFMQIRPGKLERSFKVLKIKTMTMKRDPSGSLLPDSLRITKFGSFFRRTSIDELPQLINVLKGEMSFVGPRPLLMEYLTLYDKTQSTRHSVSPGITGLAQVNGRNAISWDQKFALDVNYVENCSLKMDLAILLKTFIKVIKRSDIQSSENITMSKFEGNEG